MAERQKAHTMKNTDSPQPSAVLQEITELLVKWRSDSQRLYVLSYFTAADHVKQCADELEPTLRLLTAEYQALQRERDLAVAHDRQPYPTAEAYELVCKARDKWKAGAETLSREKEELIAEGLELARSSVAWRSRCEAAEARAEAAERALTTCPDHGPHLGFRYCPECYARAHTAGVQEAGSTVPSDAGAGAPRREDL